jgi:twitching motility protein PilJ
LHNILQERRAITNQLAEASEHQAQEIAGASAAINEMAVSIDQVSSNADESAVGCGSFGKNCCITALRLYNRSIEGMDTIREQIQETRNVLNVSVNRHKRLVTSLP